LPKRKADAAKATLPPLAEKSTKLLKVNETLARRKAEAAKVAAAEREKKKTHDTALTADADKRLALKKRPLETTERAKRVTIKEKGPDEDETSRKRAQTDPVAETDEDVEVMPTPQIQPCTNYPPKGPAQKLTEEPSPAGLADAEELEAREARGKRVTELIQKEIAMADAAPKERVVGLVDVVDESEDLCYIDDDAALEVKSTDAPLLQPQGGLVVVAAHIGEGSGAKAQNPIDLDALEIGESAAHASRSPPPMSDDFDPAAAKVICGIARSQRRHPMLFSLKTLVRCFYPKMVFRVFPISHAFHLLMPFVFALILAAKTLVTLSAKDPEKKTPQVETDPSALRTSLASVLEESGMKQCLSLCL
jgi:hypothetical protein